MTAYAQENLVADVTGAGAPADSNLVNPWGIVAAPNGLLYVADNHSGVMTIYQSNGQPGPSASAPLVVTIPIPSGGMPPAAPSGIVFNDSTGLMLQAGKPALFVLSTEDGTISGWNPDVDPTHALLKVDNSAHAVYKGLALLGGRLYATNFHENRIDVFNSDFSPAGSFTDSTVPAGFAPFGIQNLGGMLYVTFAKQDSDKHDDVQAPGHGFVDLFDPASHAFMRLISGLGPNNSVTAPLNSPWGLAIAPDGFGSFSRDLLVGNFGDGHVNVFDPRTGNFLGALPQPNGQPVAIDGLWGLSFGSDPAQPNQPVLFFTAGPDKENHGLLGRLRVAAASPAANPAPPTGGSTSPAGTNMGTTPGGTTGGTTTPAPPMVSFSKDILRIFTNNGAKTCAQAGCHAGPNPQMGQNLSAATAYANIVNVPSMEKPSLLRVKPGDAANSYLYQKITGAPGITGSMMPLAGGPLSGSDMALIQHWINEGAPNN